MTWVYLVFFGLLIYSLSEGESPFGNLAFWVFGFAIAIHLLWRWRSGKDSVPAAPATPHESLPLSPGPDTAPLHSGFDLFGGLWGWKQGEASNEVITAVCALTGRGEPYLRSLLVAATLRDDEAGRVMSTAARHILCSGENQRRKHRSKA